MKKKIIIGSRKSELAITQTKWVINQLKKLGLPYEYEIKEIVTKGDKILNVTLSKVGGKGLFVKEIEQALLDGSIDFAVHSMKDMPAEMPTGLMLAAVPEREDPRDCIISKNNLTIDALPKGARVGTSSLRRASQLLAYRSDLQIESIRGNINTRLKKLHDDHLDAIVLAAAGIKRVGWDDKISQYLDVDVCIPAVGQGALGIQVRENDQETIDLLSKINHPPTKTVVTAERAFLHRLEGGCQVPIGAYASLDGEDIYLVGIVASADGKQVVKAEGTVKKEDAEKLGISVAEQCIANGADQILSYLKGE